MDIRIAFAGLAHNHGRSVLEALSRLEGVSVVGIYDDTDAAKAAEFGTLFNTTVYTDFDELLRSSGANVLLTADVNAKRPEKIIRALRAGLDVITDKPMATNFDDLEAIEQALRECPDRKLFLLLTERYTALVETAKKLIDGGEIGRVVSMVLQRPHRLNEPKRPAWMFESRLYGGIINDIGVHDIDLARWFAGCEVEEVVAAFTANRANPAHTDFEDCGQCLLRMADGSAAYVHVNWMTPDAFPAHGETRFVITGTEGQLELDVATNTLTAYNNKKKPHKVKLAEPEVSCGEDALRAFSDPAYKPRITSMDAVMATRVALTAQALAWNETDE